ncbi:uncharacterized protein LOC142236401 [Haematobia irritans]|uniref:uncharacterized protein LOC142236401 n=1 Tax=Haematobia irritans TaxID=7368 RepID=UPI003F50269D
MFKFIQILLVASLAFALCSAEAPRFRTSRLQVRRNRFLARQEVADESAAATPYPSADELKPEVPFDEAVAAEEQTPNQPDEVYGPPEQDVPAESDDVAPLGEGEDEEVAITEEEAIAAEEEAAIAEEEEAAIASARLIARRGAIRKSSGRSAKLRKAAPARLQLQRQFATQPIVYYIAH